MQGGALGAKPKIKRRRRRNSASIGRKEKGGAKSRGKEDQVREQRRQEEMQKILSMDISNPYHDMNIEDFKKHALSLCQRKLQESVSQSGLGTPTHPPHKRICHMMGLSGTSPYDVFVYLCICIFCFCTFDTLDYHF